MLGNFDVNFYDKETMARDIYYFLSKFRNNLGYFSFLISSDHVGDFKDFAGGELSCELMELVPVFNIVDSSGGKSVSCTYEQYLCMKESTKIDLPDNYIINFLGLFVKSTFVFVTPPSDLKKVGEDSITFDDKFIELNDSMGISLFHFVDLLETGDVSLKNGGSYDASDEFFEALGFPVGFNDFVSYYYGLDSDDFASLFYYIKPRLLNSFLYPNYLQDTKKIEIGDINVDGGGGGSSSFTPNQAELISKALCKILLTVDPFERNESILEGAGLKKTE